MSTLQAKLTLDVKQFETEMAKIERKAKSAGNVISSSFKSSKPVAEIKKISTAIGDVEKKAKAAASAFKSIRIPNLNINVTSISNLAPAANGATAAIRKLSTAMKTANGSATTFNSSLRVLQASLQSVTATQRGSSASSIQLSRNIDRVTAAINRQATAANALPSVNGSSMLTMGGSSSSGLGLGGMIGTYFGVSELVKAQDTWTTLGNRIRLVTDTQEEFITSQKAIVDTSKQTGQTIDSVASTYQSLARAHKELGITQEQVAQLTNTISKTMVIGGGSAESNAAALVQLGQAFSSGVLRGEEFNSVMEQAPALAQALAKGLEVPVGSLRGMAEAGQLTSDRVVQALLKMRESVDLQFGNVNLTISQSAQVLRTYFAEFIGGSGEASGAAKMVSESLILLGKNIDYVVAAVGVFVGYKIAAFALGAAKAMTLLTASFVAKASAATAAALATNGSALAMGRAGVAAAVATPSILTLSGAFGVLTAAASGVYAAFAPIAIPIAAATSSLIAFDSAMKFKNGEDASNTISDFVDRLIGLDPKVESLGTKLYDLLHPEESAPLQATIKQEIRTKVAIDIDSGAKPLAAELKASADNFGLSSEQIKINNELAKIEAELKKESNNAATQESLIRSKNLLTIAKEDIARKEALERFKKESEERTKEAEKNIESIKSAIKAKEDEVMMIGKSKDEIEKMKLAAQGATTEQQNYISSLQKVIDANEEQAKKQARINETLESISDARKTAGMNDIEKSLYELQKQGATGGQIAKAREDLEATKAIKDANEAREKADKLHEKEMQKAAKEFADGVGTFKDIADKQDTANMSRYERNNAKWAAIREQERQASMMSVFFGGNQATSASSTTSGIGNTSSLDSFMTTKNAEQFKQSTPNQSGEVIGTINLNVANESGIVKMFSLLGTVKTLKDLGDFVAGGIDMTINNGALANA